MRRRRGAFFSNRKHSEHALLRYCPTGDVFFLSRSGELSSRYIIRQFLFCSLASEYGYSIISFTKTFRTAPNIRGDLKRKNKRVFFWNLYG